MKKGASPRKARQDLFCLGRIDDFCSQKRSFMWLGRNTAPNSDVITVGSRRDEGALISAVHELAATRAAHEDFVGDLLDKVIGYEKAGKLEWEAVSELSKIRAELHERAIKEGVPGESELKTIANSFWRRHGIDVSAKHERASATAEEVQEALAQAEE